VDVHPDVVPRLIAILEDARVEAEEILAAIETRAHPESAGTDGAH
jgi:vacuolar-type H+-ATPase subunit H